jgi:hypothetical protein
MERVVTIPIYETREIEPYPSCEGIRCKENITPKLAMMVKECPRFKRILEEALSEGINEAVKILKEDETIHE